ncbi:MAG TPA: serine hydrolase domain-containing protein [Blastocatellia bacterium]|nr:serine hydrolase domain-containing protein [Blastocatellia bacterium]
MAAMLLVAAVSQSALPQARAQTLEARIRDYAREHNFNGTILVQHGKKKIYHQSFGLANRAFGVPINNHTKFRIASITKAFTAALILQLYEQGKLDLHATIGTYLPGYAGEGAGRATIHNLLNHTSGIQNFDTIRTYEEAVRKGMEAYQLPHTTDELLTKYCSGKLVHEVGKVFDYNNADYIILGKVIEKITSKSYDVALKERILDPLKMTDSGMLYQRDVVKNLANTYFKTGDTEPLINDLPVYTENWYSAGGMYSTASDLLKFSDALYGASLLKPETLSLMLKSGLDDYGYGLWVASTEVRGKKYRIAHRPGSIMGANVVLLRFLNEDLTIIILSNTNATNIDAFSFLIGRAIIK